MVTIGPSRSSPSGFEKKISTLSGSIFFSKTLLVQSPPPVEMAFFFFRFFLCQKIFVRGDFGSKQNHLKMAKFSLKTYSPKAQINEPHFYILCKGNNSGKPLTEPCPNCFVLTAKTEEDKQFLYSLCFGLWKAKSFEYFLKGSVIPFITIGDCKQAIISGLEQAKNDLKGFNKSVKALELLEQQEKKYLETLQLINDAKRAIFYRYISKR